ncbi:MAG: putative E3 ubiquitin-protein ligase CHFR, partial [Streblomastix strix]
DDMENELQCGICSEIMHNCVSVISCLHTFCSFCLSMWLDQGSNTCPHCRNNIDYVVRNFKIRNVVDAYLTEHPDKKRDKETIEELEKNNQLTEDKLRKIEEKKRMKRKNDSDDEDNDSDENSSDSDDGGQHRQNRFGAQIFGVPMVQCRQCTTAGLDGFICGPNQSHKMCQCCIRYFPDRTLTPLQPGQQAPPPTQCLYCKSSFCNLYWGCTGPNGDTSFRLLKDMQLVAVPQNCILNNQTETDLFIKLLNTYIKLTPDQLWKKIINQLIDGSQAGQINRTNSTASSQQGSSDNENSDKDDDDDDQQQGAGVNNV